MLRDHYFHIVIRVYASVVRPSYPEVLQVNGSRPRLTPTARAHVFLSDSNKLPYFFPSASAFSYGIRNRDEVTFMKKLRKK